MKDVVNTKRDVIYFMNTKTSEFDQQKYIQKYNEEHYKTFKVNLKNDEMLDLEKILKENNLTKAQFLRNAIQEFKHSHNSR